MADTKISGLPAATLPLAGTEVLPIVQGGITEKVAVDDLTVKNVRSNATTGILQITGPGAGTTRVATVPNANWTAARTDAAQSFTGDQTLSTGNLVIGTSGKGIDFSATPGTGTSELLADYEEGTFTPTLVGTTTNPTVTYSLQRGVYTKVGRVVVVTIYMGWTAFSGGSGNVGIGGLPFPVEGVVGAGSSGAVGYFDGFTLSPARTSVGIFAAQSTSYCLPTCFGSGLTTQYVPVGSVAAAGTLAYQMTYFT